MKMFEVGECRVCHKNCIWMPMVDGILAEFEVCSNECLDVVLSELQKEPSDEPNEILDGIE
jgi:hypothetical protein